MKTKLPKLVINLSFGLLVGFSLLLLPASLALAADAIKFTPQVAVPGFATGAVDVGTTVDGKMTSDLLARYIKAMYDYGLKAAGILAAVILMGGGLIWLTSAGNESKIGQAKEMIVGAISGLVILFSAWLILNTVNPALLSLTPMQLSDASGMVGSCCEYPNVKAEVGIPKADCEANSGVYYKQAQLIKMGADNAFCADSGCCRCKVGGGYTTLFLSNTECADFKNSNNKITPEVCEAGCQAAGEAMDVSWEYLYSWGQVCSANNECVWSSGGTGGSW
jgi:hypothetical protein